MNDKFKAIVLSQSGEKFTREVKVLDKSFFKDGDVLVKVDYSALNYKDALILNNGAKLVKEYPHIPGIDFSGQVQESESSNFKSGDKLHIEIEVNTPMYLTIFQFLPYEEKGYRVYPLSSAVLLTTE